MKKLITVLLTISMLISVFCPIAFAKSFSDVPQDHWAFKYVDELSNSGVINGYEDGTFRPNGNVTKAEFVKLLMVADEPDAFKDLSGGYTNWYDPYFDCAEGKGVLVGTVSRALANEPITRLEMAEVLAAVADADKMVSLYSDEDPFDISNSTLTEKEIDALMKAYMESKGIKSKKEMGDEYEEVRNNIILGEIMNKYFEEHGIEEGDSYVVGEPKFDDTKELDWTTQVSINAISEIGLITGYEDNTFRPENNMTRAEVATVIQRFMKLKGGK